MCGEIEYASVVCVENLKLIGIRVTRVNYHIFIIIIRGILDILDNQIDQHFK